MNRKLFFVLTLVVTGLFISCYSISEKVHHVKDLDENMLDLRAYHENLGEALKQNDLEIAEWLAIGMDSVLMVMADHDYENKKLEKPFAYYYQKKLKTPIKTIKESLKKGNRTNAVKAYVLLTEKCNSCHTDLDAGKDIYDWSK